MPGLQPIRWTPANGPGPLDLIEASRGVTVASTFRSSSYTQLTTTEVLTLYRTYGKYGNPTGNYWTFEKPAGSLQAQLDLALKPQWGSTGNVATIQVPKGTEIFVGFAGEQQLVGGTLYGGGSQVWIPRVEESWLRN